MCRLAAYVGAEIPLEAIISMPRHSLLEQSQGAVESKLAVNGDGFGIAWYGQSAEPGLYRDVLPAWSDGNLTSICRMVRSQLFLAHVRASTEGETSRLNCHPFVNGGWAFAHNGRIAAFSKVRRALEASLPDNLYITRRGTTDSELFFLLLLSFGLAEDPKKACERAILQLRAAQPEGANANRLTCVMSNGAELFAFRHSCDRKSPTLYLSGRLDHGGQALASEPLDGSSKNWTLVPEDQFIRLCDDGVSTDPMELDH